MSVKSLSLKNMASHLFSVKRKSLIEITSSLLILLFVYAAVSKLVKYDSFKFQLGKSPYTTDKAGLIAWALPTVEIVVALSLFFKKTQLIGLYASFFLMLLFTGYIYAILNFSYYVPCSCGGVLEKMSWNQHFWFNVGFTLIALIGILLSVHKTTSNRTYN